MVHLTSFFDNFTIPPPSPHTMLEQCSQSAPLEATSYGEGGGASLGKLAAFNIKRGVMTKT